MKPAKIICALIFLAAFLPAQNISHTLPLNQGNPEGLVKWLSFREAQEMNKKMPKPFLIDVYTDWCGWCKHMMKTTYSDPGLAQYINTYFYPVKFNAETKDTIEYNGNRYVNESAAPKSPHQLARKLLNNSLTYPSTVFVGNNFQFNLLTQGYLEVKKIEPLLIYTVENIFRTSSFDDFKGKFDLTYYDTLKKNHPEIVKWHSWKEALKLQQAKPKKILVSIGTTWCNGCKIMNQTTFSDSLIINYLDKNYYLVDLNAETKDTLVFDGKEFHGSSNPSFPFHSLTPVLTKNNLILPSLVFIDEKQKIIESVPFYQGPKSLDPILHYFGDNIYQKTKWEDFIKSYKPGSLNSGKSTDSKLPVNKTEKKKPG